MLCRLCKGFKPGCGADEHVAHLKLHADFTRVEMQVRVDFQGNTASWFGICTGGHVDLLHEVEEGDVVALLVETRTSGDGEEVAARHGVFTQRSDGLPVA